MFFPAVKFALFSRAKDSLRFEDGQSHHNAEAKRELYNYCACAGPSRAPNRHSYVHHPAIAIAPLTLRYLTAHRFTLAAKFTEFFLTLPLLIRLNRTVQS